MGAVAAAHADIVYLTSDNPRNESADIILDQIARGLGTHAFLRNSDRRETIQQAIAAAVPGDTVLIAGKGHETYQVIGDETFPFDDHEVAKNAILMRNGV